MKNCQLSYSCYKSSANWTYSRKNGDMGNVNNICEKQLYFALRYNKCYKRIFFCSFIYSKKRERYNKEDCFIHI